MNQCKRNTKAIKTGILLILILGIVTACGKKKIDVTDTLTVKYSGSNGYGKVEIEDAYAWETEALKEAGIDTLKDFSSLADTIVIESAVSYEVSPKENLSNGDKITVKATINNAAIEKYNFELISSERKFTVEGLPEIEYIDLFENVEVIYRGIAPDVTATVNNSNTDSYVVTNYELDKNSKLNIGDVITVTAKYDQNKLLEAGYIAESDTKEFSVQNVAKYVAKISDIPEDIMTKMKKQMEDTLQAQVAAKWSETESMVGMNFLGNYLLTLKSGMNDRIHNAIYLIYKIDVANSENSFSYYTYCRFEELILLEDGTCSVDLSNYKIPTGYGVMGSTTGEAFSKGSYYYLGYEQIDSLFNKCVTANIENYEYESNVVE